MTFRVFDLVWPLGGPHPARPGSAPRPEVQFLVSPVSPIPLDGAAERRPPSFFCPLVQVDCFRAVSRDMED
eukprot:2896657-Pyramimonas_sp.AAC.1